MSNLFKKVTSAVAGLAIVFSVVSPIAGVSAAIGSIDAANKLALLQVIEDHSANPADYRLGDNIQRREHVKTAMKLASCQAVEVVDACNGDFSDMDSSDWGCKYAEAALEQGYIAPNATFNPGRDVSKAEALKMIMNATGVEKGSNPVWEAAYVEGAVSAGVIDSSFSDYTTAADRGWTFIVAANAVDLCGEDDGDDDLLGSLLDGLGGDDGDDSDDGDDTDTDGGDDVTAPSGEGEASISLSPETPANGLVAVDTPRTNMLAFDVTAGSSDVTLEKATLYHVGLGDRANVDNVEIYNSSNESVSKNKSFSDNDLDISFDKDVVVKAGETQTFMVTATISGGGLVNTTYQLELASIEASSPVSGGPLVGAALTPTVVSNSAELSVDDDTASNTITIGEEVILAGFSIEENNDNEDVIIRTITLHQNGSADADYLEDLVLEADGSAIASNLSVNDDDELVINLDYLLAADDKIDFELRGTISGDVGEDVHFEFEEDGDIYAVGASTGFNIGFKKVDNNNDGDYADAGETDDSPSDSNNKLDIAKKETIEGAEIDAVFDRSDIDETKVDVDDVLVGTLSLTANSNDYEVTKITVTVTGTALATGNPIDDLNLGGTSYDSLTTAGGPSLVYVFEDINLSQGTTEVLDLEMDVLDNVAFNGTDLTFDIKVTEVEDDENNITYTASSTPDLGDILSSNSFEKQTIDIESATFILTQTDVNDRNLVLGNGVETVLYKAKISAGDSDDVSIEDMDFTLLAANVGGEDLDDVIDTATLNIGGTTYDGDIDSDSVDFTSINHTIAGGADNVELLLTAILKDNDSVANNTAMTIQLQKTNVSLEDSDGEDLATANYTHTSGGNDTTTTLLDKGTFKVRVLNDVDTDDNLENTVLAGESNVVIAEVEIEAEYEDMRVKELTFTIPNKDFSNTLDTVSLVSGSTTIVDGAVVTLVGTDTRITFKDDFVIADDDDLIEAELVADLNPITGTGDETSAIAGDIAVTMNAATDAEVKGVSSADDITADITSTATGENVSIVPTKLVFTVEESLSTGAAKIKITADSGNNTVGTNNETPEVVITALTATTFGTDDDYEIYKEGNAAGKTAGALNTAFGALPVADRTFDTSATYVFVPRNQQTTSQTYTVVLSGNVATYDVNTVPTATTGIITNLETDVSVGTTTVQK